MNIQIVLTRQFSVVEPVDIECAEKVFEVTCNVKTLIVVYLDERSFSFYSHVHHFHRQFVIHDIHIVTLSIFLHSRLNLTIGIDRDMARLGVKYQRLFSAQQSEVFVSKVVR